MQIRVWQRVRVVGPWDGDPADDPAGREGTVMAEGPFRGERGRIYQWLVALDGGREIVAHTGDLEPILPDVDLALAGLLASIDVGVPA